MFESTPTAELIKEHTYTMTAREAEYLRANVRESTQRADFLEGPDGPKTPKGHIPAATKREIDELRKYARETIEQLRSAPPLPITFCQALRHLTRPLVKMVKSHGSAKAKFLERFVNSPTYALEWNTSDVIATEETMHYARGLLSFAGRIIKERGHTVKALIIIRDGIASQRDEALRQAISNITYSTSSSPTANVAKMFQQHGRIAFVNDTAWPLLSQSSSVIDAYKVCLELKEGDK